MDLARGCRAKQQNQIKHLNGGRIGLNSDTRLVIKLPDSRVLRVMSRSVFLALFILTLPCIGSIFKETSYFNPSAYGSGSDLINFEFLEMLLKDLGEEGVLKKGDKALIVSSGSEAVIDGSWFLKDNDFDLVMESDLERKSSLPDEAFDFAFAFGSVDIRFVDRLVKIGGIVALQLSNDLSNGYQKQSNSRIVYLRQYGHSTIVAMRKTGSATNSADSSTTRQLCQLALEAKKAALKGLEDALLEPPRRALAKTNKYVKKIKFLPDLLGDSLENYSRRIFIDVGFPEEKNGMMEWFRHNYPTRNQEFEVYHIEMMPEDASSRLALAPPHVDVSDWLMKHVREEEYVVLKAEAEVVEEMIRRRTICLVDELFLECKNQWQDGGKNKKKSKRAYWECLALYGRLRDEGVAVHQWWN